MARAQLATPESITLRRRQLKGSPVGKKQKAPKQQQSGKKPNWYRNVVKNVSIEDVTHSEPMPGMHIYSVHVKAKIVLPDPNNCTLMNCRGEVLHNGHSHGSGTNRLQIGSSEYYQTEVKITFNDAAPGQIISGRATAEWMCNGSEDNEGVGTPLP